MRHLCLFIPLNQYLPNPDRATAITKSFLHRLSCPHNAHSTDFTPKTKPFVRMARRRVDLCADKGKVVEAYCARLID